MHCPTPDCSLTGVPKSLPKVIWGPRGELFPSPPTQATADTLDAGA
jgi:hypothetical protein